MSDKNNIFSADNTEREEYNHLEAVVFHNKLDCLIDVVGNYISYAFLVSCLISFYEVISRYVFDAPTIWVHETTIMICALCMAYGGAYCLARDSHIRIKLLYDSVGTKVKKFLQILNSTLGLIYCLLITYAAFDFAKKAMFTPGGDFRLETTGSAWNPIYPAIVKGGLFVVLTLMCLQCSLHLIKAISTNNKEKV